MSLSCHQQALQLIKDSLSYCGTPKESMSLTLLATFFSLEAFSTCTHQLTASYSAHHNTIKPPTPLCWCNIDLRCHIINQLHIIVLKLMYACERPGLFMFRDYMHNVNFLPWLWMKILSLFVYSKHNLRVSLRFLPIPPILLFASPSCQLFMQFICRSHRTLKPLRWNHDRESCPYQLSVSKGSLILLCFSAKSSGFEKLLWKIQNFQSLISY